MPLLNYTTEVDVEVTLGRIQKMLSKAGAMKVMTDYDTEGIVMSLSFALRVNDQVVGFKLPCDWRPIQQVLADQSLSRKRQGKRGLQIDQTQCVRVAWRIVEDWMEAQFALIETRMVKTEQVFLPYMVVKGGQTLYEQIANDKFLLGDGK